MAFSSKTTHLTRFFGVSSPFGAKSGFPKSTTMAIRFFLTTGFVLPQILAKFGADRGVAAFETLPPLKVKAHPSTYPSFMDTEGPV